MDHPDIFPSSLQEGQHMSDHDLYETRQRIATLELIFGKMAELVNQQRIQLAQHENTISELNAKIREIELSLQNKRTKEVSHGEENTDNMEG